MPEAVSVIIISSQKSAPVAITLISYITSESFCAGTAHLPIRPSAICPSAHLCFFDLVCMLWFVGWMNSFG
jgi:hypothetical protein